MGGKSVLYGMNDNSDHPINVGAKAETLVGKGADPLWDQTSEHQGVKAEAPPRSQNLARKSYIAAWKAAHPERQREYTRRWRLKQGVKVSKRKWLTHAESLKKMQEIPQPFSSKQFAMLTGITHGGACNLFNALIAAGKIQFVKKLQCARFYEICSSVPLIPRRDTCVSGGDLAQGR